MIDGADREDHDADARDPEVDVEDAGEDPGEAADASEDQPAMALVGGSDEGGTVGDDSVDEDEAPLDEAEQEPDYANEDLGLVSDDDALPWLESSDYDDIESVDAWRITGFVVLGLVALALLVGGIWYFTNRGEEGEPVADGSVIQAPEGPYKERPEDPGGKTFEGTGDMAPAVGEGETREGRLAEGSATPEPIAEPAEEEEPAEEQDEAPSTPVANDNRIVVQVGAYRDKATAEAGWRQLQRQTDALSGVQYRIVRGEADIGTVYRLQAVPGDMAAARRLRDALRADGVASQIKN